MVGDDHSCPELIEDAVAEDVALMLYLDSAVRVFANIDLLPNGSPPRQRIVDYKHE